MKKNYLPIVDAICVSLGFAMATGVDYNPWQAVYAVVLMAVGAVCFNAHDRMAKESEKNKQESTIGGVLRDAA